MLPQIGTRVCNTVFDESFCNGTYGKAAKYVVLAGLGTLGFNVLKHICCTGQTQPRPMIDRVVERTFDWRSLEDFFAAKGHIFSDSNEFPWGDGQVGVGSLYPPDVTKTIMWGKDRYTRKFVTCRVQWWPLGAPENKKLGVFTIFQESPGGDVLLGSSYDTPSEWHGQLNYIPRSFEHFLQGETVKFINNANAIYCCRLDSECEELSAF